MAIFPQIFQLGIFKHQLGKKTLFNIENGALLWEGTLRSIMCIYNAELANLLQNKNMQYNAEDVIMVFMDYEISASDDYI